MSEFFKYLFAVSGQITRFLFYKKIHLFKFLCIRKALLIEEKEFAVNE
jgi:hypothetical protein